MVTAFASQLGCCHPALFKTFEVEHITVLDNTCIGDTCGICIAIVSGCREDAGQFHHHLVHVGKLHLTADIQLKVVVEVIVQVEGNLVVSHDVGTPHGPSYTTTIAHIYIINVLVVGQQLVASQIKVIQLIHATILAVVVEQAIIIRHGNIVGVLVEQAYTTFAIGKSIVNTYLVYLHLILRVQSVKAIALWVEA